MSRERPRRDPTPEDHLSTEDMIAQAAMDAAYPLDVLNTPITPDDVEALEAKRLELLATAKKIKNTAAAILEERKDAEIFVSGYIQREKEVDEGLVKVKELRKHWEDKIVEAHHEVEKLRRDMITPRRITFATPTGQQPLATPKDNMTKAAELLKKKDEEIDIDFVRKLVASAVQQQSKADTSRRLASNPDICVSTAQKDAPGDQHRDDESRTGSTERRREAREHPNPIPVPSDSTPRDPARGKGPMYTGRDKYRVPSPPPRASRPRYPLDAAVLPEFPGPMGQAESAFATRCRLLETGTRSVRWSNSRPEPKPRAGASSESRTRPEPRRSQGRDPEPRSRNEERDPEPRRSGTTGQPAQRRRQPREPATGRTGESMKAEAGGRIGPLADPSPPPSGGTEVEAEVRPEISLSLKIPGRPRDARERLNEYRTDYIGPKCFGRMIREEPKPRSSLKLPGNLKHYDGTERPDTWIEDYYNAVTFAGGTPNIACRMLQLYLGHLQKTCHGKRLASLYPEEGRILKKLPYTVVGVRNETTRRQDTSEPEARPRGKGGKGKNKDKDEDSSEAMEEDDNSPDPKSGTAGKSNPFDKKSVGAYHTFLGTPTVRATKSAARILNAIVPAVPQYVRWSEIPCTFDIEDHPVIVPKECYALVVSPRIDGYDFSKCLMDGGASLNIMYLETLERMNLTKEQLKHSTTEFHGVVPGKKANSLGSITLPVAFGDVHNFREERITFEVVPFKSSYHVIFGRPTYHKFHARACYIYNKLKIPGPKGATYQRTMQRCLKDQIGRNVHAYVDDIAVMTRKGSDLISDLTETFENLRRYKMMLNPLKCVFGVSRKTPWLHCL
ncbi:hypothetical protein QYE76_059505 [Lolium multiflorum]|uniref:Reverse transcriptase domain-containing protein n=1 Tax=Lolium multiflorum TaxID=4521 RepID=A0AAD8RZG6_LOLMU|nr:hypothetical protein QYE76_059505 [Lolium multiflorum]